MPAPADHETRVRHWLDRLARLRTAPGRNACRGKAPHKPLLLLGLLDLAEKGELPNRTFTRTPDLALRFREYGSLTTARWPTRLDLRYPFFHLSSDGFWAPFTAGMTRARTPEECVLCELDPELHGLLGDADFRLKARLLLISTYFTPLEQTALLASLDLSEADRPDGARGRVAEDTAEEVVAQRQGRNARFAVEVCRGYHFTCALTGYCCDTSSGYSIIDAAHIKPWSETGDDTVGNGLALSKNAHWQFDTGLWSADDELRVLVNREAFTERGPEAFRLAGLAGRHLQFHPRSTLRPSLHALRDHRRRHGLAAR